MTVLFLYTVPPPSVYKTSCPTGSQGGWWGVSLWTDVCHPPPQLPASEIKQTFLSTNLACLLAFWAASSQTPHLLVTPQDVPGSSFTSLLQPWSQPFPHRALVPFMGEWYSQILDTRYCPWLPGLLASLVAQMVKNLPMQETWVLSLGHKIFWKRNWQPTPVFLPGKSPGQRSRAGYSPWDGKESRHDWACTH